MKTPTIFAIISIAILSACASSTTPAPEVTSRPSSIQTGPNGLLVAGSDLAIDFYRTQASAIASTTKLLGSPPDQISSNADCGAGPTDFATWDAGLQLLFQGGNFRGWVVTSPSFKTTGGIAPGLSQQSIETAGIAVKTTTLGSEFDLGGVFGLIESDDDDGKVTTMWAGTSCFFR